jgi:hypothetical protein
MCPASRELRRGETPFSVCEEKPAMPRQRTPLRCPICNRPLKNVQIIPIGKVTASLPWEIHAGRCDEHGWFQAEVISKPPREIFPVERPGGAARPIMIDGTPVYSFPTVWNSVDTLQPVDPYDERYWAVDWSRLPRGTVSV